MIEALNKAVEYLARALPLEIFVVLGSVLEEVLAPIPSPFVTTLAGTLAQVENYGYTGLAWLIFLAAVGKTLGAIFIYYVSDKAEDLILIRFGPKIGLKHQDVEKVGRYFTGSIRDYFVLIFIRALPIIPSLPVSVAGGVIKLPFKLYTIATFIGTLLRSGLFVVAGYTGLSVLQNIAAGADSIESVVQIIIVAAIAVLIGWAYYKRRKI